MIKIAVAYDKFATAKSGGARESLLTLLEGVTARRDIAVDAYQTRPVDDHPDVAFEYDVYTGGMIEIPKLTWTNQVLRRVQWRRYFRGKLNSSYDLVITQNDLAPASVAIAQLRGVPSLFFARSLALTGYGKYDFTRGHVSNFLRTDLGGKVQYPFLYRNFQEYRRASRTATCTIANSEFTGEKLAELFGVDPEIIYPPIDLDAYEVEYDEDGYVTMVNPRAEYKGVDIFFDIAEKLPDREFLLVGPISSEGIKARAEEMKNVTHWKWCEDMREAYGVSKVVVVPSRVEESFGRVPAEAMVSGIPCVVSDRGGLPWVVGDTGVVVEEIESTRTWIEAIEECLETHDPEAQKRRVQRFSAANQTKRLLKILDELIPSG